MSTYKEDKEATLAVRAEQIISDDLPEFCKYFFQARRDLRSSSQLAYCYDFRLFFEYLKANDERFSQKEVTEYTLEDVSVLRKRDIEDFFTAMETYEDNRGKAAQTKPASLKRLKASLSGLWTFYITEEELEVNPFIGIKLEKIQQKDPVRLNADEVRIVLETVTYGTGLAPKILEKHEQFIERDYAIILTLLHSGIRVAELAGLDEDDVDFRTKSFYIDRKGNKSEVVYFSDAAASALSKYISVRNEKFHPYDTNALFLNRFGERMTERSIERMLEKYVAVALPYRKHISPHKLRSTFACDMLEESGGQIELVGNILGHSKLTTTQVYAKTDQIGREAVRNLIEKENPEP